MRACRFEPLGASAQHAFSLLLVRPCCGYLGGIERRSCFALWLLLSCWQSFSPVPFNPAATATVFQMDQSYVYLDTVLTIPKECLYIDGHSMGAANICNGCEEECTCLQGDDRLCAGVVHTLTWTLLCTSFFLVGHYDS